MAMNLENVNTIDSSIPEWYRNLCTLVWPKEIPLILYDSDLESWKVQGFEIAPQTQFGVGFNQPKNGPCGLLAAIQALLLKELIFGTGSWKGPAQPPTQEHVTACFLTTLCKTFERVNQTNKEKSQIVLQKDPTQVFSLTSADNFIVHEITFTELLPFLGQNLDQIKGPGGAVLLLYSLVLTAGIDKVKSEIPLDSTLIVGNWGLCTQAVVNFCILGKATSDVDDDMMLRYTGEIEIGLLTFEEVENITFATGCTLLADSLKHPKYPIWIIHGGDHYTTLFGFDMNTLSTGAPKKKDNILNSGLCVNDCGFHGNPATLGYCSSCYKQISQPKPTGPCKGGCGFFGSSQNYGYCSVCLKKLSPAEIKKLKEAENPAEADYTIQLYHFNGLPPAGPVMTTITISKKLNDNSPTNQNVLRAIAMVIQRRWAGDERNGYWEYEVAQRFDNDFKPADPIHFGT